MTCGGREGTHAGYQQHTLAGEEPCGPCRDAERDYNADYRARNAARLSARRIARGRGLTRLGKMFPVEAHALIQDELRKLTSEEEGDEK